MKKLNSKLKKALGDSCSFQLDTSEQSYVKYPTNHINLVNDNISIAIGTIVYENIKTYDDVIGVIKPLYDALTRFSEDYNYVVSISYIVGKRWDLYRLRYENDDQLHSEIDFSNIYHLLKFVRSK